MDYSKERPVSTSISLEQSKLDAIKNIAIKKGHKSRNELIYKILTNWLEKENKSKKGA